MEPSGELSGECRDVGGGGERKAESSGRRDIFVCGGDVGGTKWTNELKTEQEFTKIWIVVDNDVLVHDQTLRDASTNRKDSPRSSDANSVLRG